MVSVCIIGSHARSTADALSDRDVLLVGVHLDELAALERDWVSRGWNVSMFNRPAFGRLAEVRSLFVQHVKQEGQIVRDDDHFLRVTLTKYSPKCEYLGERNDALRQLSQLPLQDGRYWHDMCLADITYVLFRNALILHFACSKRYCFSYETLVGMIGRQVRLQPSQIRTLVDLRMLKHAYRARDIAVELGEKVDVARTVIEKISRVIEKTEASAIAAGATTDNYFHMRLRELNLAASVTPPILDRLDPKHELYELWRRMTRAHGYPKNKLTSFH